MFSRFFSKFKHRKIGSIGRRGLFFAFLYAVVIFSLPVVFGGSGIGIARVEALGWDTFVPSFAKLINWIVGLFGSLVLGFTGALFQICAKIASFAMEYSTNADVYRNMAFIDQGWVMMRDLINSGLALILIYTAFRAAFETEPSKAIKGSVIVNIAIAALLVNFSLFFVKVAVDVSNVASRGVYYRIETVSKDGEKDFGPVNGIIEGLKLQTELQNQAQAGALNQLVSILFSAIVNIVAATQFIGITFMFVARTIVIIFAMIGAPLLFLRFVLPKIMKSGMQAQLEKMYKTFFGHLVWPPVFFLMMMFVVKYIDFMNQNPPTGGFGDAFTGKQEAFSIVINYAVIIAVLFYSTKVAKGFTEGGFSKELSAGGAFAGKVGSMVGRRTIGRAASRLTESKGLQDNAKKDGVRGYLASRTLKGLKGLETSSFDISKLDKAPRSIARYAAGEAGLGLSNVADATAGRALRATGKQIVRAGDWAGGGENASLIRRGLGATIRGTGRGVEGAGEGVSGVVMAATAGVAGKSLDVAFGESEPFANVQSFSAETLADFKKKDKKEDIEAAIKDGKLKDLLHSADGKKAREEVFKQITSRFADDPEKLKKLINEAFTRGDKNFLASEAGKKEFGKELKGINKKADSVAAKKKLEAQHKTAAANNSRYVDLQTRGSAAGVNGAPALSAAEQEELDRLSQTINTSVADARKEAAKLSAEMIDYTLDEAARNTARARHDMINAELKKLDEEFDKMSTEDVLKLDAAVIADYRHKLTGKHINELSKVLAEGEKYNEEDAKKLNEMAKQVRLEQPGSEAAKTLAKMAMKGSDGFSQDSIKFAEIVKQATTPEVIKGVISTMDDPKEFKQAIFDPEALKNLSNIGAEHTIAQVQKKTLEAAIKAQKEEYFNPEVDKYFEDAYNSLNYSRNGSVHDQTSLAGREAAAQKILNNASTSDADKIIQKRVISEIEKSRKQHDMAMDVLKKAGYGT